MKHVGMRIKVLAKRAKGSRPGRLHFSLGESNTLTEAASRKAMLSEKKRDGPDFDGQDALKAEKKQLGRSEQRKWNRRIFPCCVLGVGHVEWNLWQRKLGDEASGWYREAGVPASLNVFVSGRS
jgi:hypothetical protein